MIHIGTSAPPFSPTPLSSSCSQKVSTLRPWMTPLQPCWGLPQWKKSMVGNSFWPNGFEEVTISLRPSLIGRAFGIVPKEMASLGCLDLEHDDYQEGDFMKGWQETVLETAQSVVDLAWGHTMSSIKLRTRLYIPGNLVFFLIIWACSPIPRNSHHECFTFQYNIVPWSFRTYQDIHLIVLLNKAKFGKNQHWGCCILLVVREKALF